MTDWLAKVGCKRFRSYRALLVPACSLLIAAIGLGQIPAMQDGADLGNSPQSALAAPSSRPTPDKFTLSGTVVDSATGESVPRALVQSMPRSGAAPLSVTITDGFSSKASPGGP